MKETLIKIAGFIIVFVTSAFIISNMMNRGNTDLTVEMSAATFPTVSVKEDGINVNMMHGYAQQLNIARARGDLSPLGADRSINITVKKYGMDITGLSYEIRSLDATRLVERTDVYDYTETDDTIDATLDIKDLIDQDTEYMLCVILKNSSGRQIRYYTRVIFDTSFHTGDMLKYVEDFSTKTFSKDAAKSLTAYLESNETGDNTTYADVNIHSSFDQITWGELKPAVDGDVETTILEMDENTGSLRLDYRVKAGPEDDRREYQIEEFYRVRYSAQRMYLLDYERTMDEVFVADSKSFANDKIMLGITGSSINMKENTDGDALAFVVNGSLYCYRSTGSRIARLFSFTDGKNDDERARFADHDIKILSVDEGGNVRFLVYGYMNRGRHEGEVGASVLYYDSSLNTIEEEIYIPYSGSYQMLKSNIELLAYADGANHFYVFLDGAIYRVRLDDQESKAIAENIDYDEIVVSSSGRMAAWQNSISGNSDSTITLADLGSGMTRNIVADSGNVNRPLGFIGEDFVFGESRTTNLIRTAAGTTMMPMHTIYIEDRDGAILKKYSSAGMYITDVDITGNTINLSRISMSENAAQFTSAPDDQIMSSDMDSTTKNQAVSVSTEDKENIMEIQLTDTIKVGSLQMLTPKEVLFEGRREVVIGDAADIAGTSDNSAATAADDSYDKDLYYVYARGFVKGIYREANEAVNRADTAAGVVVDAAGSYIWRIGSRSTEHDIADIKPAVPGDGESTLSVCIDSILAHEGISKKSQDMLNSGETAIQILSDNIDGHVLNLGGCTLDDVLYYVGRDDPVIATGDEGSLLIVGYDSKNIKVMDPAKGTTYKIGLNDSRALFTSHGNEFTAYVAGN